jgi:hypothetical protein
MVGKLPEPALFWLIDRYQIYDRHFEIYRFLASTGIDLAHLVTFLLIGLIVALAAWDREMAATTALGFVFAAMAVVGSVLAVATRGDYAYLWRLSWYFSDSLAIVIGGAMVRTLRSHALHRSATA